MALRVGDLYRGVLNWRMAGQECVNTLTFRVITEQTIGLQINSALNAMLDRMQALAQAIGSTAHSSVHYYRAQVHPIATRTHQYQRIRDLDFPGLQGGELLPGFVALPIYLQTEFGGRSRRGRLHVGGWVEEHQNAGLLTSTGLQNAQTLAAAVQGLTGPFSGLRMVIYSRKIHNEMPDPGNFWAGDEGAQGVPWAYVTNVSTGALLGSMYSRKIGRGS